MELAYSIHLGSDKNKKNSVRVSAKTNKSGTTSMSNNAIQNAQQLSRVDKHNYRKYDNEQDDIVIVRGTSSLYNDVKKLYLKEFEEARIKYNETQRETRKIKNYFSHISNNAKNDLACELIIELGNKQYWDTKDINFKKRMTSVYSKQVEDLELLVPNFKVASAIIHYDETSPHMHIVGVPIKYKNKNGMEKQVGKSDVFTKESLATLQKKMRVLCIEYFNKEYNLNDILKPKLKGRNIDINVSDMDNYTLMKEQLEKNQQKLEQANEDVYSYLAACVLDYYVSQNLGDKEIDLLGFNSILYSNEKYERGATVPMLAMLGSLTESQEYYKIVASILGNHNIGESSEQIISNLRNRISNQQIGDRMDSSISHSSNQCDHILKKTLNSKKQQ